VYLLGYTRVSPEERNNFAKSHIIQELQIKKYCELYNHKLVAIIQDLGVSATVSLEKRPGGMELIDRLMAGEAAGLLIQQLNCAFAITPESLVMADRLNRQGISVHSIKEQINTAAAMGWYHLSLVIANAGLHQQGTQESSNAYDSRVSEKHSSRLGQSDLS